MGLIRPAQEHLASAIIRRTLSWLIEYAARPLTNAPVMVATTPTGQNHELGAMMAAAAAASHGWRVIYLGTSLPALEIATAAVQTRATAVALSLVHPADDPAIPNELRDLRSALPRATEILAGGAAIPAYAAALDEVGARRFTDIGDFRLWAREAARSAR